MVERNSRIWWKEIVFAGAICLSMSFAHLAYGVVLYDNFGPGDSYIPGLPAPGIGGPGGVLNGAAFSIETGDFFLDAVDAAIFDLPIGPDVGVTLSLYDDNNGVPGQILESQTLIDVPVFFTNPPPSAFTFSGTTRLEGGHTYYLIGSVNDPEDAYVWLRNDQGIVGNGFSKSSGDWVENTMAETHAMRVYGTAVPESVSTVQILGLLGIAAILSRRQ